jgi:hypothetical protein
VPKKQKKTYESKKKKKRIVPGVKPTGASHTCLALLYLFIFIKWTNDMSYIFLFFWKKKSTQLRKYMHPPHQRSNLRPQQLYTRKPSQPALKHDGLVVLIQRRNRTKLSLISGKQFLTSNGDGSRLDEMEGAKIPAYRLDY